MCRLALWLYLITMTSSVPDEYQYCGLRYRRLCQGKGYHIACRFPESWDRELAQLAQRLADQCSFVHDDCRATVRYPYPGQTVGEVRWRRYRDSVALSAQRAIRRVFNAWWGEKRRVRATQLISPFKFDTKGAVWGHFSQLAVWNLRAVGCGAVRHGAAYPRLLLVCDYSHTNMLGQRTLVPGKIAQCPLHTIRRHRSPYSLLCGPVHPANPEPDVDPYEYYYDDEPTISSSITVETSIVEDSTNVDTTEVESETTNDVMSFFKNSPNLENQSNEDYSESESRHFEPVGISNQLNSGDEWRNVEDNQLFDLELIPRPTLDARSDLGKGDGYNEKFMDDNTEFIDVSRGKVRNGIVWQQLLQNPVLPSNAEKVIPLSGDNRVMVGKGSAVYISTTTKNGYAENDVTPRQRWQITRNRPTRPGANAFLHTPPGKLIKRPFIDALKLDKEDIDQLFKDTGFSYHWAKNDNNH